MVLTRPPLMLRPPRLFQPGASRFGGVDDAGHQAQHAHVVAALERDFLDLLLRDQTGAFGALRLDARGLRDDRDRLGHLADVERDGSQRDAFVRGEHDRGLREGLEALESDGDVVGAGEEVGGDEVAVAIGDDFACRLGAGVLDADRGAREDAAGTIADGARRLPRQSLAVERARSAKPRGEHGYDNE